MKTKGSNMSLHLMSGKCNLKNTWGCAEVRPSSGLFIGICNRLRLSRSPATYAFQTLAALEAAR